TRRIAQLRGKIQECVDGLFNAMREQGPPADLVSAVVRPLPITIVCEMLGIPLEDCDRIGQWLGAMMGITAFTSEEIAAAGEAMWDYLERLVQEHREQSTDNLLGVLVETHGEPDRLTDAEMVSFSVTLLIAGSETTANQIGNFVYTLLTHPEQMAELRADPALLPAAIEELLRITPLGASVVFPRITTAEVELSGVRIPEGETGIRPAQHRQPRPPRLPASGPHPAPCVFDHPEEMDFHRPVNPHLAFGRGAHHCIGASLARMELQVAIGSLLHRFPRLELAGEAEFRKESCFAVYTACQ